MDQVSHTALSQHCFRKKQAIFVVFDLSDQSSFHKATEFFSAAYENEIHTKLLIGNKAAVSSLVAFWIAFLQLFCDHGCHGQSVHSSSVSFPFQLSL